ncbi:hypothetical protein MAR_007387 [Mya arenaria]|uniref:Uncharacterized protein n=1 Tax=Mya arenaria TaxID=6604 RepID=A0ABY7DCZ0_MYAAR|nr:hypothetical protein MAR_007387 [Mya arenaria]
MTDIINLNVTKCIELADTVMALANTAHCNISMQARRNETLEGVTTLIHKSLLESTSKAISYSLMGTSSVLIDGPELTKDVHMPLKSNAITSTHFWAERTAGNLTLSLKGRFQNVTDYSVNLTFIGMFSTPKEDAHDKNTRYSAFGSNAFVFSNAILLLVGIGFWTVWILFYKSFNQYSIKKDNKESGKTFMIYSIKMTPTRSVDLSETHVHCSLDSTRKEIHLNYANLEITYQDARIKELMLIHHYANNNKNKNKSNNNIISSTGSKPLVLLASASPKCTQFLLVHKTNTVKVVSTLGSDILTPKCGSVIGQEQPHSIIVWLYVKPLSNKCAANSFHQTVDHDHELLTDKRAIL